MTNYQPLFGRGALNVEYAQYFTGDSYLQFLASQEAVSVNSVTFKPKARNDWHIHHDGFQILLVTDGEGWYQAEGHLPQKLKKGDVVSIDAGIKHWHGATKDSWFTHVAIGKGTTVWLESVNDELYNQL
ncbi:MULTISPECIES: cupin domain-containing protein [unclassified Enterococcus]|uniref:cupin domain-containing protein n=1 Tax=unclassified Enterococcus TaxID=2608891 RepID=UPI0015575082|nr:MULTISPECIES: cupin domain-containing protein [unclassified Enterococcus]MBS7576062.1 cupin domain-containing protein [Enterococcus sp. MMGLQ5-2]MBS7583295.1 cupin domain-containing protein [Enterococcus sp. MMGLQ5-1]NPD11155.1 cupin domain-containing protein [Enterococcus sp. MMGLQ5-1]NPD35898.1 cupin domain-containing protein [Enterococcus sp. MMGLQ5-2]